MFTGSHGTSVVSRSRFASSATRSGSSPSRMVQQPPRPQLDEPRFAIDRRGLNPSNQNSATPALRADKSLLRVLFL